MNNVVVINNIHGYSDEKGIAWLAVKDLAVGLGLGYKLVKNGKTYDAIRWTTMEKYLREVGYDFMQLVAENEDWKDAYVPENVVYKLLMKVNNEAAKPFQDLVCDEILPSIRRTGIYTTPQIPKTPAQIAVDEMQSMANYKTALLGFIDGLKPDVAEVRTIKHLRPQLTQIDCDDILTLIPGRTDIDDIGYYTPTTLGKIIGEKSAKTINVVLEDMGLQIKTNKTWKLTECGKEYGEMLPWENHGHSGFRISWNEKALDALKKYFNI